MPGEEHLRPLRFFREYAGKYGSGTHTSPMMLAIPGSGGTQTQEAPASHAGASW